MPPVHQLLIRVTHALFPFICFSKIQTSAHANTSPPDRSSALSCNIIYVYSSPSYKSFSSPLTAVRFHISPLSSFTRRSLSFWDNNAVLTQRHYPTNSPTTAPNTSSSPYPPPKPG
ncbi:hypothetical protein G7K_0896-t1 [Saitoella complicata NRRL Y-17804]|uniref:Uncharacterized protein n=1 Tax=Saitoella complicata (strain BCRC 22490 / CBS 7301 / JCM 7358 / NBRC 10748 / NRRL Y-17804) TaxID=698492 RepID=A0A0E9NAE2_SAICN|nr:hypothetical protein G7K_0896-t1 [Saitoella complicata NRRL Y-17804]